MTTYLIAAAALGLAWLIRTDNWRRMFRWYLVALALKVGVTAWVMTTGTAEQIRAWLLIADPLVLALHVAAVGESWALLMSTVYPVEWRALTGLCVGIAVLAMAGVMGYWTADTSFSVYSDVRMCLHFAMLAFLAVAGLWIRLHGILRLPQVSTHSAILTAQMILIVGFGLYRPETGTEWRQAQQWFSALLFCCLGGWIIDALLNPRKSSVDVVNPNT